MAERRRKTPKTKPRVKPAEAGSPPTGDALTVSRLVERETLLRTIVESSPECVKLLSADGILLQMNQAGLTMLDADSADQVVGQQAVDLVSPEHKEAFRALVRRVAAGASGRLEFEVVTLKGARRWLDMQLGPLRPDGASRSGGPADTLPGPTPDVTQPRRAE